MTKESLKAVIEGFNEYLDANGTNIIDSLNLKQNGVGVLEMQVFCLKGEESKEKLSKAMD